MFSPTAPAYLAVPNEDHRHRLVDGRVLAAGPAAVTIEFDRFDAPTPGTAVTLMAERQGRFFQQSAMVSRQTATDGRVRLTFTLASEPVSAERRGCYRTSAIALNVPVGVDRIAGCVLADVSSDSVGVICPKPLTVGTSVTVALSLDGYRVNETLTVQCVKTFPCGRTRFGLGVACKRSACRRTLEALAGHLQRVQLRRLCNAA